MSSAHDASSLPAAAPAPPLHPFVAKSSATKRVLPSVQRDDSHAFVLFQDDAGYNNAIRDEMRIFGVLIRSNVCRVFETRRVRTLIVELTSPMRVRDAHVLLTSVLGPEYAYRFLGSSLLPPTGESYRGLLSRRHEGTSSRATYEAALLEARPVFLHIEFQNHQLAWHAMSKMQVASTAGLPLRPAWVKSSWYRTVADKARLAEMSRHVDALSNMGAREKKRQEKDKARAEAVGAKANSSRPRHDSGVDEGEGEGEGRLKSRGRGKGKSQENVGEDKDGQPQDAHKGFIV